MTEVLISILFISSRSTIFVIHARSYRRHTHVHADGASEARAHTTVRGKKETPKRMLATALNSHDPCLAWPFLRGVYITHTMQLPRPPIWRSQANVTAVGNNIWQQTLYNKTCGCNRQVLRMLFLARLKITSDHGSSSLSAVSRFHQTKKDVRHPTPITDGGSFRVGLSSCKKWRCRQGRARCLTLRPHSSRRSTRFIKFARQSYPGKVWRRVSEQQEAGDSVELHISQGRFRTKVGAVARSQGHNTLAIGQGHHSLCNRREPLLRWGGGAPHRC